MHQSVSDMWVTFNEPLEGFVDCLYADAKGLITCGMGNLADPMGLALGYPWRNRSDGSLCSRTVIVTAWLAVKGDPDCITHGWRYAASLPANQIYLERSDIEQLIRQKLAQNDQQLTYRFDEWASWPADAQLAVHSMAWAMGTGFAVRFPKFTAACRRRDFDTAVRECAIMPERGTVIERNKRNRQLLQNAAIIDVDPDADRGALVYPRCLTETLPPSAA